MLFFFYFGTYLLEPNDFGLASLLSKQNLEKNNWWSNGVLRKFLIISYILYMGHSGCLLFSLIRLVQSVDNWLKGQLTDKIKMTTKHIIYQPWQRPPYCNWKSGWTKKKNNYKGDNNNINPRLHVFFFFLKIQYFDKDQ